MQMDLLWYLDFIWELAPFGNLGENSNRPWLVLFIMPMDRSIPLWVLVTVKVVDLLEVDTDTSPIARV